MFSNLLKKYAFYIIKTNFIKKEKTLKQKFLPGYLSITVVPIHYTAAPSIDKEDVSLPSAFLRRQASLTKGNFA